MTFDFKTRLADLRDSVCELVTAIEYETPTTSPDSVTTRVRFSDGTQLSAEYWRLIARASPVVSVFDHRQQYGLPAPIDAIGVLRDAVVGKRVMEASMNAVTGDLTFRFEGGVILEVFNFTGYEIWQVTFSDGTCEYSNYALRG